MEPAFSYRRGVYDLSFDLDVERRGGQRGRVRADSVLHAGDFLDAQFDIGKGRPLKLKVDAMEASGGALAGALGLKADQPFAVKIAADGRGSTGAFTAVATSGSLRPTVSVAGSTRLTRSVRFPALSRRGAGRPRRVRPVHWVRRCAQSATRLRSRSPISRP